MTTRTEQKLRTRRSLLDAALELLSAERVFSSLSLREVTRTAGIAPTSFYRHFDDMNDLGLALVEEAGLALRQLLRKARTRIKEKGTAIETSIDTFMEYLVNHTDHFRLLLREHTGNSKEFRTAIKLEISHFVTELDEYLKLRSMDSNKQPLPPDEQYALAEAMVIIVFNMGASALDSTKKEREKIVKRATLQLKMLNYGAPSLIHR
ncbi:MAG: AcrR family transcriptional regulator [Pseudohongiellaceae bacterium]